MHGPRGSLDADFCRRLLQSTRLPDFDDIRGDHLNLVKGSVLSTPLKVLEKKCLKICLKMSLAWRRAMNPSGATAISSSHR